MPLANLRPNEEELNSSLGSEIISDPMEAPKGSGK